MRSMAVIVLACAVIALIWSSTQTGPSAPESSSPAPGAIQHPIGQLATPHPAEGRPGQRRFAPYDIGGSRAAWLYEDLTAAEQVIADRGRESGTWAATHDAYGGAGAELAARAATEAAALRPGAALPATLGAVP